ncbi:hypothetical protein [Pseudoduganella sp. HUAS MS19]
MKTMRTVRAIFAVLVAAVLASCTKPVPPAQAGRDGNMNTSIRVPLKEFEGDNLIVGAGPVKTVFVVSSAPHEDAGNWTMTVDGVKLVRK